MGALRDQTRSHTGGLLLLAGRSCCRAALVASLRLPREPVAPRS
jgi:hypothetical protein